VIISKEMVTKKRVTSLSVESFGPGMAPPERVIAAVRVQTALFQTPLQFAAVCMHKHLTQGEKIGSESARISVSAGPCPGTSWCRAGPQDACTQGALVPVGERFRQKH
jgi:hypothetical protein